MFCGVRKAVGGIPDNTTILGGAQSGKKSRRLH